MVGQTRSARPTMSDAAAGGVCSRRTWRRDEACPCSTPVVPDGWRASAKHPCEAPQADGGWLRAGTHVSPAPMVFYGNGRCRRGSTVRLASGISRWEDYFCEIWKRARRTLHGICSRCFAPISTGPSSPRVMPTRRAWRVGWAAWVVGGAQAIGARSRQQVFVHEFRGPAWALAASGRVPRGWQSRR